MTALIDNERMDGDIESELLDISDATHVSLHITSAIPEGGSGHAGTIYFRQSNLDSKDNPTPVAMAVPTVEATAWAELGAFVELTELAGRYLQVFYDRTSGDGWLTVRAWRKPQGS